ncbi:MAG: ABC transporter ATP-binding protein [Clostridia bacterium]|nr:ABC transporter ATP-binding protein [Clostridia bacterium]
MIALKNLYYSYGKQPFLQDISANMADGCIIGIIGPNGSGKSTLLRLCAGILKPDSGEIQISGRAARAYNHREFARELAFLPQSCPIPMLTVRTLVENGRYPHLSFTRKLGQTDKEAVEIALEATGMQSLAERELRTLSGGERQKAYVAMLIAQGAQQLLLDEPTTNLDVAHQLELMALMHLLRDDGKCIIMVMHDIDLAIQHCDEIMVMSRGRIIHRGCGADILSSEALEKAYGVRALPNTGVRFEKT